MSDGREQAAALDGNDAELCWRMADHLDATSDFVAKEDQLMCIALRNLAKKIWSESGAP